ncbi:hypothetical protein VOLCADRAFT_99702 [Volvox carteri f. nagariensis]|uniref:K Homology domain-containing protein n=1 Tax=Volvox carteri f. nagariensis TaxID=3068 RepID=D8UIF1_VOLCA|nr:uncharacterized protein VOLCADRAFT_99702 [Volvox carteri f. nagariensis]EFJ40519.1 hypothetical protein VOLCADRAFT_99702 [Volvox carteri f. nagariensis]|eukprot:XP_002958443.1 hypothetical protein VOLCADRAFT_99702 [Volvox carteri f. nagariensis]
MQQQPGGAGGRRQTAVVACPKSMIGRVIGRNGETIKALQTYTGALIQIDQTCDPTKIAISGTPQSLSLALSMVNDIVRGTFKGFALLRQATGHSSRGPSQLATKPVYAPGYGLIPPSQLYGGETTAAGRCRAGTVPATEPGRHTVVRSATAIRPVYNIIGGPTFGAPVYLSPYDYTASALAPAGVADVMLVPDGSSLFTSAAAAGGAGSRLFHTAVTGAGIPRTPGGGSGGFLSAAASSAAMYGGSSLGSGAADILTGQPMAVFGHPVSGAVQSGMHRGSGGTAAGATAGLFPAGTLVMDPEGGLYTYMDG